MKTISLICAALALVCFQTQSAQPLDEKGFAKLMKEIAEITKRNKTTIENKNTGQMATDAKRLEEIYAANIAFWRARKTEDAVKWSEESLAAAKAVGADAVAADWEKVKAGLQDLMKSCKSCHDTHREKLEDGSYRIK